MLFWSSDHHFYHKRICEFSQRPFSSVEEMNEGLINNHNKVVSPNDTCYFLGDFSFARTVEETQQILERLNGNKHFISGNHDEQILKNRSQFIGQNLFQSIQQYKKISNQGQSIIMFHYGCRVWEKSHYGSWLLFGHSHNSLPPYGKSVDVGVDSSWVLGEKVYRPFSFDELKVFMDAQSLAFADGHKQRSDD